MRSKTGQYDQTIILDDKRDPKIGEAILCHRALRMSQAGMSEEGDDG